MLPIEDERISAKAIKTFLKRPDASGIFVFDTLESTNQEAKNRAVKGAEHGTVILSEEQTKGRGRFGRSFYSPPGSGIYMTFILRTSLPAMQPIPSTVAAAVAVSDAIEKVTGIAVGIKWVNDILIRGRKVCGILAETVPGCKDACIVLGIGINYAMRRADFPPGLRDTAAALFEQPPANISRNRLAAAVIDNVLGMGPVPDAREYLPEYKRRSAVLQKRVRWSGPAEALEGIAVDIDESGGLVIVTDAGERITLSAGEVSIGGVEG